ncbi:MAG: hypothetical protein ACI4ES_14055 [Roseburia sp.]
MAGRTIRINLVEETENYIKELGDVELERNAGIVEGVSLFISNLPKSFEPKGI